MIKAIIQYLLSTMRHKWFVLIAGRNIVGGIPMWRLIIHDWTKFMPVEFINYAKYYVLPEGKEKYKDSFVKAWMHHQKNNKHHPEYWTSVGVFWWSNGSVTMPPTYVREWVADLLGASREYTDGWQMEKWLVQNIKRYHYCTRHTKLSFSDTLRGIGYPVYVVDGDRLIYDAAMIVARPSTTKILTDIEGAPWKGSPTHGSIQRNKKFNWSRFIKLYPVDKMVFGRIDNDEYFTGIAKYLNPGEESG